MEFELTEELEAVRGLAREVAQREFAPKAAELDRTERFPVESFKQLGELGLLGVNVPEHFGGSEMGVLALTVALEEVAAACASTAVTMSVTNMVGETICRFGNDEQKTRFVPRLASGELVAGAFCLSEPGSGSDAAGMATTARRDGDDYILNGTKAWITSGSHAGVLICMARTGEPDSGHRGISAFLLEPGMSGLDTGKPEDKCGLRGSNTVSVILEDCRVPLANRLGDEGIGFGVAMTALDGGRITIGSMANGIARAAGEQAAQYALERKQFGKPIAEFQAIQHKLADMATGLEAARLLVRRAAWLKEQAVKSGHRFTRQAAMAKVFATENAKRATEEAVQILGGYGYTREYPVERYMRDARVTTIFEGTTEIQKIVIAREILKSIV